MQNRNPVKTRLGTTLLAAFVLTMTSPFVMAEDQIDLYENLVPVEDTKSGVAYIDPNADFSVYKRVMILDSYVAFRSGWERDQRSGSASKLRINPNEIERIKTGVADLFKQVFTDTLQADGGYEIVDNADEDVLLLRPAIIDLDITAPDTMGAGRSTAYSSTSGSATLYIELYDSVSGQILGRAVDKQTIRNPNNMMTWTNRATNTADARKMFGAWAQALRDFLDSHYKG